MILFSLLILFFLVSYVILVFLLYLGFINLSSDQNQDNSGTKLFISVVVPFRNESMELPELIDSLANQTYPKNLYEVILVNDHSNDVSFQIASKRCKRESNFRILSLQDHQSGKKEALFYGISHSKGAYVLQTDADCTFDKFFIGEHAQRIEKTGSDLIAGPVTYRLKKRTFTGMMETLDFLGLAGSGAGSFYYNTPIMCNGANLSYSKALFFESKQFDHDKDTPSGDDMFLLIAAKKLGKKISYLKSQKAIVYTNPTRRLSSFLKQRQRWASKAKYYKDKDIILSALIVLMANLVLLLSLLLIPVWNDIWKIGLLGAGLKLIVDFLMLNAVTRFTRQSYLLWVYFPVAVLYYFYIVYIAFASLFLRLHWKGRAY